MKNWCLFSENLLLVLLNTYTNTEHFKARLHMHFFTCDTMQFQEIIALLSHIKISVCSMYFAGNAATSEKLAVSYCSRVDRLYGDTCSYICPQIWLNEARTNIGLSPAMGFLNENDSLAYSAILGELSSGLSFTMGFFKTSGFPLLLVGFLRGQGRTYLATP